jgi:hypothetical protein
MTDMNTSEKEKAHVDDVIFQLHIICLHVEKVLADVPMVTAHRNVMNDIKQRAVDATRLLQTNGES